MHEVAAVPIPNLVSSAANLLESLLGSLAVFVLRIGPVCSSCHYKDLTVYHSFSHSL